MFNYGGSALVSCGGDGDGVALEHRGEERGEVMVSIQRKSQALADLIVKRRKMAAVASILAAATCLQRPASDKKQGGLGGGCARQFE
jgi:hypothetical protein